MSDSSTTHPELDDTEQRLRSLLMMNSGQPQEGTLGRLRGNSNPLADVRDVFARVNRKDGTNLIVVDDVGQSSSESPHDGVLSNIFSFKSPAQFRDAVRSGHFTGPTNGVCPGFMQCNLVVLEDGPEAYDFLLFCQRNKKACPLIEVCDVGSPFAEAVAAGSDLRTDIPK